MNAVQKLNEFQNQTYFFQFVFYTANAMLWGFYMLLLLRESNNDVSLVFYNFGIFYLTLLLGTFVAGLFIHKVGYLTIFRLQNWLLLFIALLSLLTLDRVLEVHLVIAAMRGIAMGMFYMCENLYLMREVRGANRARLLGVLTSVLLVLEVVLPLLTGATITLIGYQAIFILAIATYLIGALYPWTYNKHPHEAFRPIEFNNFMRRKGFKRWSFFTFFNELLNNVRNNIAVILPFLLLGSELSVGALASVVGLVSAATAFLQRNDGESRRLVSGFIGGSIITVINVVFLFIWNLPGLIVRELGVRAGLGLFHPAMTEIGYRTREQLLDDFKEESNVELHFVTESLLAMARLSTLILFILLFEVVRLQIWDVLKILFAISIIRELFAFTSLNYLSKVLKKG